MTTHTALLVGGPRHGDTIAKSDGFPIRVNTFAPSPIPTAFDDHAPTLSYDVVEYHRETYTDQPESIRGVKVWVYVADVKPRPDVVAVAGALMRFIHANMPGAGLTEQEPEDVYRRRRDIEDNARGRRERIAREAAKKKAETDRVHAIVDRRLLDLGLLTPANSQRVRAGLPVLP